MLVRLGKYWGSAAWLYRKNQLEDTEYFIDNPKAGLLYDPGVGKTVTAALYSQYCWDHKQERSVWIQPKSIMKKNRDEILRFTDFAPADVVIVQGTPAKRLALMKGPGKVWLFTADGWSREWELLLASHPDVKAMLCDEIHLYYAGHTSKRTQSWYVSCRKMRSIIPMSGTVIKGKLSSVYPILHVCAPQYYGSYEAFMNQHAQLDEYGKVCRGMNHEKLKSSTVTAHWWRQCGVS